jgi:ABC-2 type transport system permease protein
MTQEKSRITHHVSRLLNPIIVKELRTHMRGSRAFWILTGYLLVLGLLAYGLYRITLASVQNRYGPGSTSQSAYIGQTLFIGLAFLELLSVCFVTPALTAGVISGEIERRTYDMLLATPLRPTSILWGKMVASLTYVNLLILAAIPLSSVVFLFGGVALRDVIQAIGLLALTAVAYGTLGLFFSALTRRTGRAMVLSYLAVLFFTLGSLFTWAVIGAVTEQMPPHEIMYVNPISALASAIISPGASSGLYGMGYELLFLLSGSPDLSFSSSMMPAIPGRPLWQYTTAIYLALTVVFYLLTTQLVKPVRHWRIGWRGLVALLIVLALLVTGSLVVFGTDWGSTGWRGSPTPTPPISVPVIDTGVVIERVVEVPVPPALSPPPTPTPMPTPTPIPFDASEHETAFETYLPQELLPGGKGFCDLEILWTHAEFEYAEIVGWVYCRTFDLADGELVPGVGTSTIARLGMYWKSEGWQIGGGSFGTMPAMTPPEVQQQLLETPYDEAAGEERLRERARQELLGE